MIETDYFLFSILSPQTGIKDVGRVRISLNIQKKAFACFAEVIIDVKVRSNIKSTTYLKGVL